MLARTILVATDFSEHAERATQYVVELAQRLDAKVHLVHAWTVPVLGPPELAAAYLGSLTEQLENDALRGLDTALERYKTPGVQLAGLIKRGDARESILEAARELGADLIVVGTHGRRGVARALLGSVAEHVLRHATCPVLTVR